MIKIKKIKEYIEVWMFEDQPIQTGGIYDEEERSQCQKRDKEGLFGCGIMIQWGYYDKRDKQGNPVCMIEIPIVRIKNGDKNYNKEWDTDGTGYWQNHWMDCKDKVRMRKYFDELKRKK